MEPNDTVKALFGQSKKPKRPPAKPAAPAPDPPAAAAVVAGGCTCLAPEVRDRILETLNERIYGLNMALCRAGCKGSGGEKEAEMLQLRDTLQGVRNRIQKVPACKVTKNG